MKLEEELLVLLLQEHDALLQQQDVQLDVLGPLVLPAQVQGQQPIVDQPILNVKNIFVDYCISIQNLLYAGVPDPSVADPKLLFRIRFRIRIRPLVSFGFGSGFGSGFESGFESWIRIRIQILGLNPDQKQAKTSCS